MPLTDVFLKYGAVVICWTTIPILFSMTLLSSHGSSHFVAHCIIIISYQMNPAICLVGVIFKLINKAHNTSIIKINDFYIIYNTFS